MRPLRDACKPSSMWREGYAEKLASNKELKRYHGSSDNGAVFTHITCHVVDAVHGESFNDYPFTDEDKEWILRVFKKYLLKYKIDCLSFCIMSNHIHLLLVADNSKFSQEEAAKAYNKAYEKEIELKKKYPMNPSSPACERLAKHSNDISSFMKDFQGAVTKRYNAKYDRKGTLFRGRFKSIPVERQRALVNMIVYIELNPVRAGIVGLAEDYQFCSFAEWRSNNKHSWQDAFDKYLKNILTADESLGSSIELYKALKVEIQNRLQKDHDLSQSAKENLRAQERLRFSESVAVGSRAYVLDFHKRRF